MSESVGSLLELPELVLQSVSAALYPDAKQLVRLSACCRAMRVLDNDQLWQKWIERRFGPDALPARPPRGPVHAAELEGYMFIQGMDPGRVQPVKNLSDEAPSLQELVAATKEAGADAFTTDGRIFKDLPPPNEWRRRTLDPREGIYIEHKAAAGLQLADRPPMPAHATWPPVPDSNEWIYFGGVDGVWEGVQAPQATGPPQDLLPRCSTVEALLELAASRPGVAAVTTGGEALAAGALRPQAAWRRRHDWGTGVYVRTDVARRLQLRLPEEHAGPHLKQLYAELALLTLDARDMTAAWLDGFHLIFCSYSNRPMPSGLGRQQPAPAEHQSAIRVANVCWLDVSGSIPGVMPGRYQVAWCVGGLENAYFPESVTLEADVKPGRSSSGADTSSEGPSHMASPDPKVIYSPQQLKGHASQMARTQGGRRDWCWLPGGEVQVLDGQAPATVRVSFHCRTNTWKHGVSFAFAQLLAVETSGVAQLPPLFMASDPLWRMAAAGVATAWGSVMNVMGPNGADRGGGGGGGGGSDESDEGHDVDYDYDDEDEDNEVEGDPAAETGLACRQQ